MDKNSSKSAKSRYFAAANGYDGFRSYFEEIFSPKEINRLFILKGGPGTGKSSFMKKAAAAFESVGVVDIEEILCSSDPGSLDGVIIRNNGRAVAIIDGTAPHEKKLIYPGACESIIDLGAFWNEELLREKADEIKKLSRIKSTHYERAYKLLGSCGRIYSETSTMLEKILDEEKLVELCNELLSHLSSLKSGRKKHVKLLSAFGKDGYTHLESDIFGAKQVISLSGVYGSEHIFLNRLKDSLASMNVELTYIPSPFSHSMAEGLYIHGADTLISIFCGEKAIDTSVILNRDSLSVHGEIFKALTSGAEGIKDMAQEEFSNASNAHFMLEAIYTPAMDFGAIEKTLEETVEKAKKVLNTAN